MAIKRPIRRVLVAEGTDMMAGPSRAPGNANSCPGNGGEGGFGMQSFVLLIPVPADPGTCALLSEPAVFGPELL